MTWMFIKGLIVGWLLGFAYAVLRRWINEDPAVKNHRWN